MISRKCVLRFSKNYASWSTTQRRSKALATRFYDDFKDFYPKLLGKTIENYKYTKYYFPAELLKKVSEYHTLSISPTRGALLLHSYEYLEGSENISDSKTHQAYVLGCVLEAVQASFMIEDDVMEGNEIRGNKTAWHLLPEASVLSLLDTHMLRTLAQEVLRQNMDRSVYTQTVDILNEMLFGIETSRHIAFISSKDFSAYTMENYNTIAQMSSFRALYTPLEYSLLLSNKANDNTFQVVRDVCNDLGLFMQIKNDFAEYLDYDNKDPSKYKSIVNAKCSWPAVTALQKLDEEGTKIFKENYGSSDMEKLKRVKQLYDRINLKELYKQEETMRYDMFVKKVKNLPKSSALSPDFFLNILQFLKNDDKYAKM